MLKDYTFANRLRRQIATALEGLRNDSGEVLTFTHGTIGINEPIFTTVYKGRFHASKAKNEACPCVYMVMGATSLSGHPRRTLDQTRTLRCFILLSKDFGASVETGSASIEDTLDYYRARVVDILNDCGMWLDGLVAVHVTGADDTETIENIEADYRHPYCVAVIDAEIIIKSGRL